MEAEIKKLLLPGRNSLYSEKGFTLVELMFALTILIIIVLGTSSVIINVARNAGIARKTTMACHLCQSKIEELKSFGYSVCDMSNGAVKWAEEKIDGEGNPGGIFNRTAEVTDGPVDNTKLIKVTVSWTDFLRTHKVTIPTIIANINF